ncbi:hypothetical protein [Lysobacter tyrosinilyticus]
MRIKIEAIALLALIGTANVYANANLAKVPVSVRQTYGDGSTTELSCNPDSHCVFTVYGKWRRKLSLPLSPEYAGYSTSGFITDYYYWPNSESNLSIAIEVECKEADLELVTDTWPVCHLFLERSGNAFIARRVEVMPKDGIPEYRFLDSAP